MAEKPGVEDMKILYEIVFRPLLTAVAMHALIVRGGKASAEIAVQIADNLIDELGKERK